MPIQYRKARPLNQLLPATLRWAQSLPELSRPTTLMRVYPRIANRRNIETARETLDDLLIDHRGGRQGFPPFVLAELMRLRELLDREDLGSERNR
jgi:hypothetical protein